MGVIEETSTRFYKEMSRRTGESTASQEFYVLPKIALFWMKKYLKMML
jgi:hypothetical protein